MVCLTNYEVVYFFVLLGYVLSAANGDNPQSYAEAGVMFWRPQKVGSSSFVSLLASLSFRYHMMSKPREPQNAVCVRIANCAKMRNVQYDSKLEMQFEKLRASIFVPGHRQRGLTMQRHLSYEVSMGHELCALDSEVVRANLQCAFNISKPIKEIVMIRDPLARALSIYYFWGELFRLKEKQTVYKHGVKTDKPKPRPSSHRVLSIGSGAATAAGAAASQQNRTHRQITKHRGGVQLGDGKSSGLVKGRFVYHGDEHTPPPEDIAVAYGAKLPLRSGMPGPSYTWSAYAADPKSAIAVMRSGRVMPLVTERMDEALVVAAEFFGWSIADVVVVLPRKAMSPHPKAVSWPQNAIRVINESLQHCNEIEFYKEANLELDRRIAQLNHERKIDVSRNVELLRALRERVSEYCLSPSGLNKYRQHLKLHLPPLAELKNKLRDVPDEYFSAGHGFRASPRSRELLFSFDVCGGCEAHAIRAAMGADATLTVETAPLLTTIDRKLIENNDYIFRFCPK